ncbi:MAG: hypothetical protein QGH94_20660, partial [Phycisphaerae bacterium]|nr:hypothetical protein [Phycisphaerae bacterium]
MPRLSPQMFLIRFIRILLSLPFVWVGLLSGMFQLPISIPLLQAAWWISADGQMAVNALSTMVKHERTEEALACAMVWMEKQPSAELAAYAGVLATITQTPGPDIARDMLESLKGWPMLTGVRGAAPADVEALIDLMIGLSRFAWAHRDA